MPTHFPDKNVCHSVSSGINQAGPVKAETPRALPCAEVGHGSTFSQCDSDGEVSVALAFGFLITRKWFPSGLTS
jgi:hypothetical protein